MTEIRKQSFAADSLMNAKQLSNDDIFIPLDYNYGRNFDGEKKGTQYPEHSKLKEKK